MPQLMNVQAGDLFKDDSNKIVCEVPAKHGNVIVYRMKDNKYIVTVDNIARHPYCDAEAVMRALAMYLMSQS